MPQSETNSSTISSVTRNQPKTKCITLSYRTLLLIVFALLIAMIVCFVFFKLRHRRDTNAQPPDNGSIVQPTTSSLGRTFELLTTPGVGRTVIDLMQTRNEMKHLDSIQKEIATKIPGKEGDDDADATSTDPEPATSSSMQ